jgi:hypothetical protein
MTISRLIKSELKKKYPHVKFSVTGSYDCINVSWTNGITVKMVEEITSKYKLGRFDGMTDSYEYTNKRDDVPQVSYIFLNRTISDDIYESKFNEYKKKYSGWESLNNMYDNTINMMGYNPAGFIMLGYNPAGFIRHTLTDVCL